MNEDVRVKLALQPIGVTGEEPLARICWNHALTGGCVRRRGFCKGHLGGVCAAAHKAGRRRPDVRPVIAGDTARRKRLYLPPGRIGFGP